MCVAPNRAKVSAITNEGKVDAKLACNHRDRIVTHEALNARLQLAPISRRSQNAHGKNKKTKTTMNDFDIFQRTTTKSPTHCTADAVDSIGRDWQWSHSFYSSVWHQV